MGAMFIKLDPKAVANECRVGEVSLARFIVLIVNYPTSRLKTLESLIWLMTGIKIKENQQQVLINGRQIHLR